jgi:hypothetical protein
MPSSLDELDVKVYIDYPQDRRNVKSSIVYAVDGTCLDASSAINCYFEPVTRTVMGMPVPMTPEWKTTFTGQGYTRFQKSDFTFSSSSSWGNIFFYGTNDCYLFCGSNVSTITSAPVQLTGGVIRNQPLFFSYIKQDKKSSNTKITAKLFWGGTNFIDKDTALYFKDDGSCDVYRGYTLKTGAILCTTSSAVVTGSGTLFLSELSTGNTIYTEDGRLIGTVSVVSTNTSLTLSSNALISYTGRFHKKDLQKVGSYSRNENNYNQQAVKITHTNPGNEYNDVFIMPMRGKELVVNTSFGLNFSHTFEDLNDPNDPSFNTFYYAGFTGLYSTQMFMNQEILPAGDFSIVIPDGKAAFQLAKLYFLSNWSVKSNTIYNEVAAQGYKNALYKQNTPLTGTIDTVFRSNIILGTGTSFNSSFVGGKIFGSDDNGISYFELGTVQTINTTTSLALTSLNTLVLTGALYLICYKKTGTITSSNSSNIITGTGTLFNTELSVNDDLYDSNNNYLGKIQSISSNTSLTLYYNSLVAGSSISYFTNIPQVKSDISTSQYEYIGPSNSSLFTDLNATVTLQTDGNITTTDDLYCNLYIKQSSISAPSNSLLNNDSSITFYSFDRTITYKTQKTKTSSVDITNILENLSVEKTEEGYSNCYFSVRRQSLIDLGVYNPDKISNRSIKITLKPRDITYDEVLLFDGFLNNPEIEYIQGANYNKYALLSFTGHCRKKSLNDIYFTKAPSYDNKTIFSTIKNLIEYSGILDKNSYVFYDPSFLTYWSGNNRNNSNGQYNNVPQLTDSVGSYIEKMRSEIVQNMVFSTKCAWIFDYNYNTYKQYSTFDLFNSSINRYVGFTYDYMYLSEQNANTYGSIPLNKAYKRTFRSLKRTYEAPEANQIVIIGVDKTNNSRITSIIDDVNSQNPYISNRPDNWLGEVKTFGYFNDRLTSPNIVSKAAQSFFDKITTGREIIEFTSDFLTYFDSSTNYPNMAPNPANTGTIDAFTYSNGVNGTGTSFIAQAPAGTKLYDSTGKLIGTVASVSSNTSLTLTTNANIAITAGTYYSTVPPYLWLNQYKYYDLNDGIYFIDETGTSLGLYIISSWKVDFIKNNIPVYASGILQNPDTINIAQATYKCIRNNVQNKSQILEYDLNNNVFSNTINVLKNTASKTVLLFVPSGCTITTIGMPTGMTTTTTNLALFTQIDLNWTPTPAQAKNSYVFYIDVNNAYGTGSTYRMQMTFKVFDTL